MGVIVGAHEPAYSQIESKKISAPAVTTPSSSTKTSNEKYPIPKAPEQVAMPAPAPIKYFPGLYEPLIATGPVTDAEDKDLDAALKSFHDIPLQSPQGTSDYTDYSKPLQDFTALHPQSNWNAALYLNIGLGYYHAGYYSRVFTPLEKSWELGRNAENPQVHRMIDRAVGELAKMHSRLGHADELEALLKDVGKRPIGGPATELFQGARESMWGFHHDSGNSYLCGPKALTNLLIKMKADHKYVKLADDAKSGPNGVSLTELAKLADKTKLKYTLVYRKPGQPIPFPSVINWNVHHYAAILDQQNGLYELKDPTFGDAGVEMTPKAVDAEASGYFLVPDSVMKANKGAGWRTVAANSPEAQAVYGKGLTSNNLPGETFCPTCVIQQIYNYLFTDKDTGKPSNVGITKATADTMVVSLNLSDTPLGYKPQKGKPVYATLYYNAREAIQPASPSYSNVGPNWTFTLMKYITYTPSGWNYPLTYVPGGGGGVQYPNVVDGYTGQYASEQWSGALTTRNPISQPTNMNFTRIEQDGTIDHFTLWNGATSGMAIAFLTSTVDPQGNTTTYNYDSTFRLTSVVDAMGRSTTFTYGLTGYPLLMTKVTDPFGRVTQLTYDTSQRLSSITDVLGITSTFTYSPTETTFITQLTTPYGNSTFSDTPAPSDPTETNTRSLTMTDPLGYTEYLYFYQNTSLVPASDPTATVPTGMPYALSNTLLEYRNMFYWGKHAFALGVTMSGGVVTAHDYTKAYIYHWCHDTSINSTWTGAVLESVKPPLENRTWNEYTTDADNVSYYDGSYNFPVGVGRVLDDGTSKVTSASYNSTWTSQPYQPGNLLTRVDGMGRTTKYNWNTNNQDLATVQQETASGPTYTTIATYGTYTNHRPASYTDAAGQVWNYTWNTAGQIATVKDPLSNLTTYNYDTLGRLSTVVDANSVTTQTLTYDSYDRVLTRKDSQGYVLTYGYDALDRVTSITYPDTTTDLYDYTFQSGPYVGTPSMELRKHTDRLGRVTTYTFDADQRLTSVTEPTQGTSTRTTQYKYYEDGTLEDIIDANGNDTHYAIDIESRPVSKTYQYGTASASTETYAYENTTSRLHSITDPLGQVKTFTYNHNDEITGITYTNTINTTPNVTFAYDTYFPRRTSMTDGTGTTTYGYTAIGTNGALKLASITSPYTNGTIALTYDVDGRLNGKTIPGGNETFGYDAINRLNSHGTPLGTFTLGYLGETDQQTSQSVTNGSVTVSTGWNYDTNTNDRRLIGITNSGITRSYTLSYLNGATQNPYDIQSITDTAAAGHPWATQSHSYTYDLIDRLLTGSATTPGNSTFAYDNLDNATTYNTPGSSTSPTYNGFNQIGTWGTKSYVYDANGNLTSGDGVKTYKYDAENRLIEIDYVGTSNKSVFAYDGKNHRISDAETVSGSTTTTYYLWCGHGICQTRNSSQTPTRRDLSEGEYNVSTGQKLVYVPDQLGSVRDVLDATTGTRVASYDFLPYGSVARSSVTSATDYQYAGLFAHSQSGLNLATYRSQDGATGRWTNRDPLREVGGINLYSYADDSPIDATDPFGLLSVYVWKMLGNTTWGHASIMLNNGTYISWWPGEGCGILGPALPHPQTYDEDKEAEGGEPDAIIDINGLNEGNIQTWWNSYQSTEKYDAFCSNCASTVVSGLDAGGAFPYGILGGGSLSYFSPLPWTPSSIEAWAKAVQTGMAVAKPEFWQ